MTHTLKCPSATCFAGLNLFDQSTREVHLEPCLPGKNTNHTSVVCLHFKLGWKETNGNIPAKCKQSPQPDGYNGRLVHARRLSRPDSRRLHRPEIFKYASRNNRDQADNKTDIHFQPLRWWSPICLCVHLSDWLT